MNTSLGRKGSLTTLSDYWTVATVFEMAILAEDYDRAVTAAQRMADLTPPVWYLKSTMNNIRLVSHMRKGTEHTTPFCQVPPPPASSV